MSHLPIRSTRGITWVTAIVMTVVVIVMLLALAGVFRSKVSTEPAAAPERSAAGLDTAEATLIRRTRYETATGSVEPVRESSVASRLLARVVEISVTAGQSVMENQILVRLDDADLQARLKQAEATLQNARSQLEKTRTDLDRATQLNDKKAISRAEFDAAAAAFRSSEAGAEQAAQAVREAQVMLEYATIRSPMSGTVIDKRVDAGDTVAPGQVLLTLYDPTHMQLVAAVRESLALKLRPGQPLTTRLDALDLDCEATISEVVPLADVSTRSFTVKVTGPCPPGVYSGMFGRLMLPQGEEEVLVVPAGALQRVGQLTMVDVVRDAALSRRYVRVGRVFEDEVEILSGLQAGDVVVIRTGAASEGTANAHR